MNEIIIKVCDKFLEEAKLEGLKDEYILIRCKDCRFWEQERRDKECGDCMYHLSLTKASDFCSYAERKEYEID